MGMDDFNRAQQGIIKRYYKNIDSIQLQRLADLAGELYLAEGKKLERTWKAVVATLEKLEIPKARIDHIVKEAKPELVAGVVKELSAAR